MQEKLIKVFEKYGIKLSKLQAEQFELYYNFLVQKNEKFNLTAITDEDDVIFKHFLDSALGTQFIKQNASLIDVGTGAGFPGIPLKILRPDLKVTLLDSLLKRVNFLNELIKRLGLQNIKAVHSRAEDFAIKHREEFDYATSRAVAQVNTLSEYLLPFVKLGGQAIMYKSQKIEEELATGKMAINILGGGKIEVEKLKIEEIDAERAFVVIQKESHTPAKYPRGKNLPKTKPL